MANPRSTPDDNQIDDWTEHPEKEEDQEEPVIKEEDVKRVKTVEDFDQFHRIILENFYAVQEAEKTEILVPLYANEDGSVDVAVVEVNEVDLHNLSEAWDKMVNHD